MPRPNNNGRPNKEIREKLGRTACSSFAINPARMGTGVARRKSISPERYKACNNNPKLVNNIPINSAVNDSTGMDTRRGPRSTPAYRANSGERMRPSRSRLIEKIKYANPNSITQMKMMTIFLLSLAWRKLFQVMRTRRSNNFQTAGRIRASGERIKEELMIFILELRQFQ